ncbi:hypothetical protein FACS189464_1890 [Bacteroidia bacterium]|nr:hypothetical protein FACS189464_1890 [Bacteroidia bacterium]
MDAAKNFIATIWCTWMAYIVSVTNSIRILMLFFVANFVIGTICGIYGRKEAYSFKKTVNSFVVIAMYLCVICGLSITGGEMGDKELFAYIIKVLTYMLLWIYAKNIVNCMCVLQPHVIFWKILKYLLEVQFVDKIPYLGEFFRETDNIRNVSAKSRGKKTKQLNRNESQ